MRNLATMLALVMAVAFIFTTLDETAKDGTDPFVLTYVAIVYTIGVVVMLIWTREWSLIGSGLLATMTGDALLYGRASDHLPVPDGLWVLDVVRACFLVGGSYLIIGLAIWVQNQRKGDATLVRENVP